MTTQLQTSLRQACRGLHGMQTSGLEPGLTLSMPMQVDAFLECSVGSLMHMLPPHLQHALQLTFLNNMQQHQPSQVAKEISAGLSALGISHSAPYLMEQGPVLVDVALLGPCPAIALQVEDPGQLAVNAPWLPLGATRLKQQTLRSKGWQVQATSAMSILLCWSLVYCVAYYYYALHMCVDVPQLDTVATSIGKGFYSLITQMQVQHSWVEVPHHASSGSALA